jgi:hypothetical protein
MGHNTTEDLWPENTFWVVTHCSLVDRFHQHFGRHKCLNPWTNRLISTLNTGAAGTPPTWRWICTTLQCIMSRRQIFKHVCTHFHISLSHHILKYFYKSSARKNTGKLHSQSVRHYIWFENDCNKLAITSQIDRRIDGCVWVCVCTHMHVHTSHLKHTLRYPE